MRHLTALTVLAVLSLPSGAPRAAPIDDIIARHFEARGGLARMRAIRSLRLTGKARFGEDAGREMAWAVLYKRPGLVRSEVTLQGLTAVEAYDGKEGWSMRPFGGRRDPTRSSADDAKQLAQEGDLDGPLSDWQQKGHRVEYLGNEDVDGTATHKLRVFRKDGDLDYLYLDTDSMLTIRTMHVARQRGVERVTEADLGNYEQVGGVWIPFSIESGPKGSPRVSRIEVERAELNVQADDALFRFPAAGAAVTRAILAAREAAPAAAATPPRTASAAPPVIDAGRDLGAGRAQHRLGRDERAHLRARRAATKSGKTTLSRRRGLRRRLEVARRRHHLQARLRQAPGAVDRRDHHRSQQSASIIWVGTGETWTRNSVSIGDGIYRSTDGGETWTNMGLPGSERIDRDPRPSPRTATSSTLRPRQAVERQHRSRRVQDQRRRQELVAGPARAATCPPAAPAWRWTRRIRRCCSRGCGTSAARAGRSARAARARRRRAAAASSARPTAARPGPSSRPAPTRACPPRPWGRVEVVIAPSDAQIVYAFIEDKDSALYYSGDGGATWEARDKSQQMVWRAVLLRAPGRRSRRTRPPLQDRPLLIVSEDGGRSFRARAAAAPTATGTTSGSIRRIPSTSSAATTAACGSPATAATAGGSRTTYRSRSSITSASTTRIPTRSTAACRTTAPGSATPRIPAASPTRAGRTCTAATASG